MHSKHCYTTQGLLIYEHNDDYTEYDYDIVVHKEIGPAHINYTASGDIEKLVWVINGFQHRNNKASLIYFNNGNITEKNNCIHGKFHNETGPAVIRYNKSGNIIEYEFYLNDIEYTYDEFINRPEYYVGLKQKSITIFD